MILSIRAVTDSSAQQVMEEACGIEVKAEPLASFNPAVVKTPRRPSKRASFVKHSFLYQPDGMINLQSLLYVSKDLVVICKVKDDGCLIPSFSVSRLHAGKRQPIGICKLEKLHHRSPPHHWRCISRGNIEKPDKVCVARTTRWDGSVQYRQSSWQPSSFWTRNTLYYQPTPLTTTTPTPSVALAIITSSSHAFRKGGTVSPLPPAWLKTCCEASSLSGSD